MNNSVDKKLICIIEDEQALAGVLKDYLEADGFSTIIFNNGETAAAWLADNMPVLILLDLMLPGKNGLELCKEVRKKQTTPIIMITARVEEVDRLIGLELGADDYMCKPFSPREVVARVKAVLRRTQVAVESVTSTNTKPVDIDQDKNIVIILGEEVVLTTVEIRLFKLLFDAPGRIFTRQYIMDNIYSDYRVVNDRTVDSHIKKLRKKLSNNHPDIELIRSVYGAGYKYEPLTID